MGVLFVTGRLAATAPELLGAATMVLAARVLSDANFTGSLAIVFGLLPLLVGTLLVAGVQVVAKAQLGGGFPWIWYCIAGAGTVFAVISELKQRR